MIGGIELFYEGLSELGPQLVLNDKTLGEQCVRFRTLAADVRAADRDCLYLARTDSATCEILQNEGNYLVLPAAGAVDADHVGPQSNAILLPPGTKYEKVIELVELCAEGMRRVNDRAVDLLAALSQRDRLDAFARVLGEVLENPVVVYDLQAERVLTCSPSERTGDAIWDAFFIDGAHYEDLSDAKALWGEYWLDLERDILVRPTFVSAGLGLRREVAGVRKEGRGYLVMSVESRSPFRDSDLAVLGAVRDIAAVALPNRYEEKRRFDLTAGFSEALDGLLTGADARRLQASAGLSGQSAMRLMLVRPSENAFDYSSTRQAYAAIRSAFPPERLFTHENSILVLVSGQDDVVGKLGGQSVRASLSDPFSSLLDLPRAWEECCAAMSLGEALAPDAVVWRYADFWEYDVLRDLPVASKADNGSFALLSRIISSDRESGGEYARTLAAYLRAFKDRRRAAEALHVHVNTVSYRVDRLREEYGLDLDDDGQCRSLMLAVEIACARGTLRP